MERYVYLEYALYDQSSLTNLSRNFREMQSTNEQRLHNLLRCIFGKELPHLSDIVQVEVASFTDGTDLP